MRLKQLTAFRTIAILLTFAVAQVSLQIGLVQGQQFIARLTSTRGNQPILVNGISAAAGASIVTGATIETLSDQTAEINLGSFGTLELAPNTQLRLEYDQNGNTKVTLIRGCAVLRSKKNAEGEIVTEQGPAAKNEKKKDSVLDVCFINGQTTVNQNAAANAISGVQAGTGGGGGGGGISGAATAGILAAVGGGILVAVLASQGDDNRPNPSPSTPQ
ncbi:MAG: hypothetical protein ND866_20185 [Pyrinomonadaceae bacterium]|nr:hypothetical protein [Pyrinomonadaceae bacterium]